jgi:hypothetical protein
MGSKVTNPAGETLEGVLRPACPNVASRSLGPYRQARKMPIWRRNARPSGGYWIVGTTHLLGAAGLVCGLALVACGGGSAGSGGAVATPSSQIAAAYLVYPQSGAYAAPADVALPLAFAARGLNASYQVVISPTPLPNSPISFALNLNPTTLPSPLGSPPASAVGAFNYVTMSLPAPGANTIFFQPVTTYTISLVGCASPDTNGTCATTQTINAGQFQTNCGMPPPVPLPFVKLALPPSGATNVSTAIGALIIQGFDATETVSLTSTSGAVVLVGAPSAVPSPLPTSLQSGGAPYVAAPIPTLSGATTYAVTLSYAAWNSTPPSCTGTATLQLGSFTTQ